MKKGIFIFVWMLIITVLIGCGNDQNSSENATTDDRVETKSVSSDKAPPVIDHLDTYPFPVPTGWKEEKFEVRQYDEGMDWEAVFTFEGDEREQALAYKEVIEQLGYETQTLLDQVFKVGIAEFAGLAYHGTFAFDIGDEYSEWGEGQAYVEVTFSEKK